MERAQSRRKAPLVKGAPWVPAAWNDGEELWASVLVGLSTVGPLEDGAHLGKGSLGPHHGYERSLLVELFAVPDEEDVDKLPIFNGITKFTEFIDDGLEALAVDTERGVALHRIPELGVE